MASSNITSSALGAPAASGAGAGPVLTGVQAPLDALVHRLPLARLTDGNLLLDVVQPRFSQIASDSLGNFGTTSDGFDAQFQVPATSFDDDAAEMPVLLQHVADADFTEGQFEAGYWSAVGTDLQTFTDTGDSLLAGFGGVLAPPDSGGGGGGGGGTGDAGGGGGGGTTGDTSGDTGSEPGKIGCVFITPASSPGYWKCSTTAGGGGKQIHPPLQE